ncbi:acyl-[acyl-carrier-protein] thioesterase [Bacteroidota bacterium]
MEKLPVYTTHETVKSFQIDLNKKLRLGTLFGYLQEAAYHHAENLEVGFTNLKESQKFWVLSRSIIQIERYPLWGENLKITTWPKGVNRIFAMRDFDINDEDNQTIIKATSAWIVIDAKTRRPVKVLDEIKDIDDNGGRAAIEEFPDKLLMPEKPLKKKFGADYTSIDLNGHVNNTKYIDWITDCFNEDLYKTKEIMKLQINFNSEMYWNDEIELCHEKMENGDILFSGNNITKETNAFQAKIKFK